MRASLRLGEVLVEEHLISRDQLRQAVRRQQETGRPLGKVLLELGAVDEDALLEAVARQLGVPFIDLAATPPRTSVVTLIPKSLAMRYGAVPVELVDGRLVVAMVDPTNGKALTEISAETGFECRAALAAHRLIRRSVEAAHDGARALDPMEDVLSEVVGPPPQRLGRDGKRPSMTELLERALDEQASDLYVKAGTAPVIRSAGRITPLHDYPAMQPADTRALVFEVLSQGQREHLEREQRLTVSFAMPERARFRIAISFERDAYFARARVVPLAVPALHALGLPAPASDLVRARSGLVLVCGPSGGGTTTTLAAIIGRINEERAAHIATVDDPIEFVHGDRQSMVSQQEVGTDVASIADGVRAAVSAGADVISVGSLAGADAWTAALSAAENGALVVGASEAPSAVEAIARAAEEFPPDAQRRVRGQLAATLHGVVCQQLVSSAEDGGAVVACEVLLATPGVRDLIRDGKWQAVVAAMQRATPDGMQTMEQALAALCRDGYISYETAADHARNPESFARVAGIP